MKPSRLLLLFILFTQLSFPAFAEEKNRDDERLEMLKQAFLAYAVKNGAYPAGDNWQIVQKLADPTHGIRFEPTKTDSRGNLLDVSGQPYLFLFSETGWVSIVVLDRSGKQVDKCVLISPHKK